MLQVESPMVDGHGVSADAPDEREFPRFRAAVQVTIASDHTFWTGLTRDIGEGGVFVVTPGPLAVGSVVDVTLALADMPSERVVATVRWVRSAEVASADLPAGMGLQFQGLPDTLRHAIQDFIDRQRDSLYFDDLDEA